MTSLYESAVVNQFGIPQRERTAEAAVLWLYFYRSKANKTYEDYNATKQKAKSVVINKSLK